MATLVPKLTSTPNDPPTYNVGMAETFSWIPVKGAGRPLFARAGYITNFDDFSVSLSAAELNISSIEIKDGNSNRVADVEDAGNGLNALRVLTQDLQPNADTVSLADKDFNNVSVTAATSSLNVHVTNSLELTAVTITNDSLNVNVLNPISSVNVVGSVTISNPITAVEVLNPVTSVTVLNPVSSVTVTNASELTAVTITNESLDVTVLNPVSSVSVTNVVSVSGSLTVSNQISSVSLTNQLTGITVLNPVTAIEVSNASELTAVTITNESLDVTVLNPVTAIEVSNASELTAVLITNDSLDVTVLNPVSSVDVVGSVTISNPVTSVNIEQTGPIEISYANVAQTDAFGRLRVSNPLTLFDSSHRYDDNGLWTSLITVNGSQTFNANQGLMDLTVDNASGSSVTRETIKVFAYMPGKSLLTLNTFVMAPSATNLRQRVGYYGQNNGYYLQLNNDTLSIVERAIVNGTPATNTEINQSLWNGDKLDGTGPSGITLDITKAQIFWTDIEWLGVGTVRCGFVIDGKYILCHSFHHANIISSTYITTASLPLRYEITNTGPTTGSHTLKQICSTVISEGGYELRGEQRAVGTSITAPRTFAAAGVFYPIVSIRLKSTRLDAIVIPTAMSLLGQGNGINYNWQIRAAGTTTGGTWNSAGTDSSVEYNTTGTSFAGGRILASGFINSSNQGSPNLDILKEALFRFQLGRDSLAGTPRELTIVVATDTINGSSVFTSIDWEEVSR